MERRTVRIASVPALILLGTILAAEPASEKAEIGYASYYAGKFQGRLTANGERFDTYRYTAAHKTLPFNTIVRVTNLGSGESTLVRINDRGPFVEGRVIDLSRIAAAEIGMVGEGIAEVKVEVVRFGDGRTWHNTGIPADDQVSIQVASFSSPENAERAARTLKDIGFGPELEHFNDTYVRVIVSGIAREDVELARLRLATIGFTDVLVRGE